MPDQLFDLGQVVITANLQRVLDQGGPDTNSMEELQDFLDRHVAGDWGNLEQKIEPVTPGHSNQVEGFSLNTTPPQRSRFGSSPRPTEAVPPVSSPQIIDSETP